MWFPLWLQLPLGLVLAVFALAYYYFTCRFDYWRAKGVKFVKPYPVVGSMLPVMTLQLHMIDFFQSIYRKYENEPFVGFFQGRTPSILVRDPDLAKDILVKDFTHFVDHGFKVHEEADPLQAKNLFNMEGQRWKEMRAKLSPTFTTGRMKAMFPLLEECAVQLEAHLEELAGKGDAFEAKELLARYTTDTIASCAFGINSNSLKDPNSEFRTMGRKLVEMDIWRGLKTLIIVFAPEISLRLKMAFMPQELTRYFRKMVRGVIELRARTGIVRKDFMQLLIELKDKGCLSPEEDETEGTKHKQTKRGDREQLHSDVSTDLMKLSDDDVTAQATVFFLAGFETSSTVMSFALLELAANLDVQRKTQTEIEEVLQRHDGKISYQAIREMEYLDWIMQESMRKYPPTTALIRICTKNYVIPGSDVTIEEGIPVVIPIHALQNDPQYFPEPQRFEPERFTKEKVNQRYQFTHMPFGEGPRQCIGYRFAKMQTKLGLLAVLRRFEVHLTPGTRYPVSLDPSQPFPTPRGKVWVKLVRRSQ